MKKPYSAYEQQQRRAEEAGRRLLAMAKTKASVSEETLWLRSYGFWRSVDDEGLATYWVAIYAELYESARRGELPTRDIQAIRDMLGQDKL